MTCLQISIRKIGVCHASFLVQAETMASKVSQLLGGDYPLFVRADLDAFCALFFDNLANIVIFSQVQLSVHQHTLTC